ncbi:TPA: hypothetical protein MYJ36_005305 [Klebsiella quasipneumoniae]|nr:hypothetical protein [Klebsiella quasipneumoniae]
MRELELELELVNTRTQFLFSQTQLMQIDLRECKERAIELHQLIEQKKKCKPTPARQAKKPTRKSQSATVTPEPEASQIRG